MTKQTPIIDRDKCCGDSLCKIDCIVGCFTMDKENKAVFSHPENCMECGHCMAICPKDAISFDDTGLVKIPVGQPKISEEDMRQLIFMRRSVRFFKDEYIPKEDIEKALECAKYAPTAKNMQEVKWVVVSGREKCRELAAIVADVMLKSDEPRLIKLAKVFSKGFDPILRSCPHVVFTHQPRVSFRSIQDSTIAISYLELLLNTMNIGTCWAGFVLNVAEKDARVKEFLNIPQENALGAGVMIGYPKYKYQRAPVRKNLSVDFIE